MDVSRRKTWINIATTLLVALAIFSIGFDIASAQQQQAAPGLSVPAGPAPSASYGIGDVATGLDLSGISRYLFMAIAGIGSLIAWLGGMLMDISIGFFTVGMVEAVEKLGLKVAINEMWTVIRDIFNLLFIFGLIFAGFKIILGVDDSASKRTVGMIVVAALLINFSLYVSQVVVDFTNVAAYQIHQMINPGTAESKKGLLGIPINNVSNQFYLITGLSENRGEIDEELAPVSGGVDQFLKALVLGFVFLIFYTILGFVFAACAIILFTRFFALIFLMIFSPLMFLGWVMPSLASLGSSWRKMFLNQALVGPALLFMIYLSLRALQGLGTADKEGGLIATIVYLLIVVAFLFASLKVAKSFGAYGSAQAMSIGKSWGNSVRGYAGAAAGSATFGLAGRIGRSQIGGRMQKYAESDAAKDAAANSWLGRRKLNIARKLGDASFDARNVGGIGKKLGVGGGISGYKTRTEEIAKRDKEYAESLGQVSNDDPRVSAAQLEVDATERVIEQAKETISTNQKKITEKQKEKNAATTDPERARIQGEIDLLRAQATAARGEIDNNKEKLDKQKENVQKEKFRRQIGDSGQVGVFTTQLVDTTRGSIKKKLEAYAEERAKPTPDQNELSRLRSEIADAKKTLAEAEKKANQQAGGLATTVENFGSIKNFFTGRNSEQNKNSGDEIRKEYKKKAKVKE